MGLTVKPIACPGGCLGCYEKDIRQKGLAPDFEITKVLETLSAQMALDKDNSWNSPTLHGGEPLLLPLSDIDAILKMVFEKYGQSGIQTSGVMIRQEHIDLFTKYKTCVGISIDGDTPETNAGRWNAPGFDVAERTQRTLDILSQLKLAKLNVSAITVMRQCNAGTPALRSDLIHFGLRLRDEFGVSSMRFNPVIAFDERTARDEQLDNFSLADAFKKQIIKVVADENLSWYPARDFINILNGKSGVCIFTECDPWSTNSEIPILGDGSLSVCMKGGGGSDGIATLRVEKSMARYEALRQVSQTAGGCRGCFWWKYCKGGCPGAGIDGDWRNRSRFCEALQQTFAFVSGLAVFDNTQPDCKGQVDHGDSHGDKPHGDSNDPEWRKANPWWKGAVK